MNTGYCTFPGCKDIEDREGFCISHAKYFAGPRVAKVKKPIANLSKKRQQVQRKYVKIVAAAAAKDNECEVKIEGVCAFFMSGMHHVIKRSPDNIIKMDNLIRCCTPCNGWIESHSKEAKELGFVKSKFSKEAI